MKLATVFLVVNQALALDAAILPKQVLQRKARDLIGWNRHRNSLEFIGRRKNNKPPSSIERESYLFQLIGFLEGNGKTDEIVSLMSNLKKHKGIFQKP